MVDRIGYIEAAAVIAASFKTSETAETIQSRTRADTILLFQMYICICMGRGMYFGRANRVRRVTTPRT